MKNSDLDGGDPLGFFKGVAVAVPIGAALWVAIILGLMRLFGG